MADMKRSEGNKTSTMSVGLAKAQTKTTEKTPREVYNIYASQYFLLLKIKEQLYISKDRLDIESKVN